MENNKIKLGDIIDSINPLSNLTQIKLPLKISYQVSRLFDEVKGELKVYEDKRLELIKEYGKENEETKEVSIDVKDKDSIEKFYKDMEELRNLEVELKFANKIKLDDLGNINIEPINLVTWLFE